MRNNKSDVVFNQLLDHHFGPRSLKVHTRLAILQCINRDPDIVDNIRDLPVPLRISHYLIIPTD